MDKLPIARNLKIASTATVRGTAIREERDSI